MKLAFTIAAMLTSWNVWAADSSATDALTKYAGSYYGIGVGTAIFGGTLAEYEVRVADLRISLNKAGEAGTGGIFYDLCQNAETKENQDLLVETDADILAAVGGPGRVVLNCVDPKQPDVRMLIVLQEAAPKLSMMLIMPGIGMQPLAFTFSDAQIKTSNPEFTKMIAKAKTDGATIERFTESRLP